MQDEKFKNAIHEAMERDYINLTKSSENHTFSPEFEKRMKRLIGRRSKPYYRFINTFAKRAVCIAASVIIISSATIMSVDALRNAFIDFVVSVYEKFSTVQTINDDGFPKIIEDVYEITYDLSNYEIDYEQYDDFHRNITYIKDDIVINYSQYIKSEFDLHINTEGVDIETVIINEHEAVYYCDNHNYSHIIWDNGDYIICLSSNIDKNELIKMAYSVKKVE